MKRRLRLLIGIVLSLAFLYLAMRHVDWSEFGELVRAADYVFLVPALVTVVATNWVRAYRWRLLMYPDRHLPVSRVFAIVNIGYLFNNILPAKAGEVVRGYMVGREISGGYGQAASSLLIERMLDVLAVVLILVVLLPFVSVPAWVTQGGILFGTVSLVGLVALLVLARFGDRGIAWLWRLLGRLPLIGRPAVRTLLENLVSGLQVLTNLRLLPGILLSSAVVWLGYGLMNYLFLLVFRLTSLPISAAVLVLVATGFSMVVPAAPGGLGVYEAAAVAALALYGVDQNAAAPYALGLHLFTILILDLSGVVGMVTEGVSYSHIRQETSAYEREGDGHDDDTEGK
jgi:uncharacterized protein (TIRG00374 family)